MRAVIVWAVPFVVGYVCGWLIEALSSALRRKW